MSKPPTPKLHNLAQREIDLAALLERIETALIQRAATDGRRILSLVAWAVIRQHPTWDGAGEEARLQRVMTGLFGDATITGRPKRDHETALLRMADMHVNDSANRDAWKDRPRYGLSKGRRPPKIRGSEKLAEAAALEVYHRTDETIVRRLKDDFNTRRNELLDLRREVLVSGEAEKELAALILELLVGRSLDADISVAYPTNLFEIEELVY